MSQLEEIIRPIATEIVEDFDGPKTLCTKAAISEFLTNKMTRQKLTGQDNITPNALEEIGGEIHEAQLNRPWTRTRLKNHLVRKINALLE